MENTVVKRRIQKSYRHPEIDNTLRGFRTRREAKVLEKLAALNFPAPRLKDQQEHELVMDFVDGEMVKDMLAKDPSIAREIGRNVGILHAHHIIHGDLTTSNMLKNGKIYFIDFGLSFFSHKVEDKAVDLHLLRCALESKHWNIYEQCFAAVLEGYKETNPDHAAVLQRMEHVEARGRNKHKGG